LQKPNWLPSALEAVHVEPASLVQSAVFSQTVIPGAGHEVAHLVPVKPVHSGQVTPHAVSLVGLPVPQQMGPALPAAVQSMASSHCQSMEPLTGHAVPIGSQVEGVFADSGVSQQCCPAVQVTSEPPFTPLKGQ
jgi:hypothetical protein